MVVFLALQAFVVVVLHLEWAVLSPAFLKHMASVRALSPSHPCSIFMELLLWLDKLLEQVGGVLFICISIVAFVAPYIKDVQ